MFNILLQIGYTDGFHVWEITWPSRQRGTHAVVGVATKAARLHIAGYSSLIGSDSESYGWDISTLHSFSFLLFSVVQIYFDDTERFFFRKMSLY